MVVRRKKKKVNKLRGSKTYGWGSKKKHRGKGSKGGKGNAGMGKRGQQKLTKLYAEGKLPLQRGIKGFKRHKSIVSEDVCINVGDIEKMLENWIKEGVATKNKNIYEIDLDKAKITKLLGSGTIEVGVKVKVKKATQKAIDKIKNAGGDVVILEEVS